MPQEQNNSTKISSGTALGLIYLFANSHATAITPIIRNSFGAEAFHPYGLVALLLMLALTDGRWASGMGIYLLLWFIALIIRRIQTFHLRQKGIITHSRYRGYPWLAMKFRFIKDVEQAKGFEPFMCFLIGAAVCPVSETLGFFIMAGLVSLGVCMCIDKLIVFKRVQQMNDAVLEGEYYAEEFKKGR